MLSEFQLKTLNRNLLDKNVYIDKHMEIMLSFSNQTRLSNKQLKVMSEILCNYSEFFNKEVRIELIKSRNFYNKKLKSVNLIKITETEVVIQWQFNLELHAKLKSQYDKSKYHWYKSNTGEWQLYVNKEYLPEIIELFKEFNFDISQLLFNSSLPFLNKKIYTKLYVTRQKSDVDLLSINFIPYTPEIESYVYSIPYVFYIKSSNTYKIGIEYSHQLYNVLPESIDKSELFPWSYLVKSWSKEFSLLDWRTLTSLPFTPYPFQPEDAKKLLKLRTGLNSNEVGCGKTFEQILIGESINKPKLVICPATLRLNWKKEILMVNPNADVNILYSDKPYKIGKEWNIISYNSLSKFQTQLEAEMIPVIMADEAHYIQAISSHGAPSSNRAKNVLRLAATAGWIFPITGTPKTNRNRNIFNILKMIRHPLTKGKFAWKRYSNTFCIGDSSTNGSSNDVELHNQLVPYMVRHLKRDVLPYLQKQRQAIPVDVDLIEYKKQIETYMANRKSNNAVALVALNAAKQIIAKQKIPYTIEHAKSLLETEGKIVIVTCYTDVVKAVEKAFKTDVVKIVGGMSDIQKQQAIQDFQVGTPRVMILNYEAGGVGITLTASHIMILNDLPWVPGIVSQAEGRIWRTGQIEIAQIYFMVANECLMDNLMVNILVNKSKSINTAIDGGFGENIDLRYLLDKALVNKPINS